MACQNLFRFVRELPLRKLPSSFLGSCNSNCSFAGLRCYSTEVLSSNSVISRSVNTTCPRLITSSLPSHSSPISIIYRGAHTSGDKELINFLHDEIDTESKNIKGGDLNSRIGDFEVKLNQAEVTLVRQVNDETVTVTLNVNHSVDSDQDAEDLSEQQGSEQLRARPSFNIDISRPPKTVSFTCSFSDGTVQQQGEEYNDHFSIDEVVMYEGEHSDKVYAVSGEILDGVLYDLLMNMLDERGVNNAFVQEMSDFCTNYEHRCYVALLQGLRSFLNK